MRGFGADVVVAGAGAIGSALALTLAQAGLKVAVVDPSPTGANASAVAAGMLAPAFETLFDEGSAGRFDLFTTARDLWPGIAGAAGVDLERQGALAVGARQAVEGWAARLAAFGAEAAVLRPSAAAALARGLREGLWAVRSTDDWRLDPVAMLDGLRRSAEALGARFVAGRVVGFAGEEAVLDRDPPIRTSRLVIATGAARDLAPLAPELDQLTPVKGHILRLAGPCLPGPAIRAPGVYLCPTSSALILGASMERGRGDSVIDPIVVADLAARAE
ncbi:MAG: NAD(P)/FAD-dependent oxidoreductase, partial [Caulobacterales bacterium]